MCGYEDFTVQDLFGKVVFNDKEPKPQRTSGFMLALQELQSRHLLVDLVQWVTGLRALPASEEFAIHVHWLEEPGRWPTSQTCTNSLFIVPETWSEMASKLEMAMKQGRDGNGGFEFTTK